MEHASRDKLSREFQEIEEFCEQGVPITLGYLLTHLEHRGHALMTLFLAGPFILPVPLPGLSTPFGLLIAFFAFSLALQRKPLLPRRWLLREIPKPTLKKFCEYAQKFFRKFESLFRPRILWLVDSRVAQAVIALMIASGGVLLALPLPPGTNSPPASVIIALSIGYLERDGLLVLIGYCLFVFNIVFFSALGIYGYEGAMKLFTFLSNYLQSHVPF